MSNPIPEGFELKEKVANLSSMLLSKHPQMPKLLREIHTTLRQYPESEICAIVNGLKVQTQTEFASTASKPAAAVSLAKKLKSGNAADLF